MYEEYYVSLPGGFQLPVAICIDRYPDYVLQEAVVPENEAKLLLQAFSEKYLIRQMRAGQIIQKQHNFSHRDDQYILNSSYTCAEIIGTEQREQIGAINGKRS